MGVYNVELFTNLGLCCFYAQQYDMALHCFQRALGLASDENVADVWYNIGHVALVGQLELVYCVSLALRRSKCICTCLFYVPSLLPRGWVTLGWHTSASNWPWPPTMTMQRHTII